MSPLHALILGLVQGITEFIPVSSSGHLKIARRLLGFGEEHAEMLGFDLGCHLGTLIALCLVLRHDIFALLTTKRKTLHLIIVALIPLVPAYFLLKQTIDTLFSAPQNLWLFFILTASLLAIADGRWRSRTLVTADGTSITQTARHALAIGCFQACALAPGLSRSGSTIAAARLFGWRIKEAVRFSYLLALPTVAGGALLEGRKLMIYGAGQIPLSAYLIGFFTSLMVGIVTLRWFLKFVETQRLYLFSVYCLLVSGLCFYLFTLHI
jgi:undecaprenyl-diphosphatase